MRLSCVCSHDDHAGKRDGENTKSSASPLGERRLHQTPLVPTCPVAHIHARTPKPFAPTSRRNTTHLYPCQLQLVRLYGAVPLADALSLQALFSIPLESRTPLPAGQKVASSLLIAVGGRHRAPTLPLVGVFTPLGCGQTLPLCRRRRRRRHLLLLLLLHIAVVRLTTSRTSAAGRQVADRRCRRRRRSNDAAGEWGGCSLDRGRVVALVPERLGDRNAVLLEAFRDGRRAERARVTPWEAGRSQLAPARGRPLDRLPGRPQLWADKERVQFHRPDPPTVGPAEPGQGIALEQPF